MLDKNLNNPINWKSNLLPNYQDMNNPLHSACRDGNVEQLKLLLNNLQSNVSNADLLIAEDSSYNWTAGHFAAYFGKVECLRLLQQASSVYNSSRLSVGLPALACPITVSSSTCGQSLLHIAAFANHRHCVQWLLEAGLPLDHQDSAGNTALHFAARSGALPCVQLLLSHKPSLSAAASAAEVAWEAGHRDVAGCIRQSVQGSAAIGSVNHLVSSNGYYGYQATHATTLSNHHTLNGVGDAGMDMETEAPSVVPVKRIREEEAAQQAKRARFEVDGFPPMPTPAQGDSSKSSTGACPRLPFHNITNAPNFTVGAINSVFSKSLYCRSRSGGCFSSSEGADMSADQFIPRNAVMHRGQVESRYDEVSQMYRSIHGSEMYTDRPEDL